MLLNISRFVTVLVSVTVMLDMLLQTVLSRVMEAVYIATESLISVNSNIDAGPNTRNIFQYTKPVINSKLYYDVITFDFDRVIWLDLHIIFILIIRLQVFFLTLRVCRLSKQFQRSDIHVASIMYKHHSNHTENNN